MNDSTQPPAGAPSITVDELRPLLETNGAFVVDVRNKGGGEQIRGALQYDPKQLLSVEKLVLPLPHEGSPIVIVDEHGEDRTTHDVAAALHAGDYQDVRVLAGGFRAWRDAGAPVEELSMKQPVPGAADHQLFR